MAAHDRTAKHTDILRSIITPAGALTGAYCPAQGRTLINMGFPDDITVEAVLAAVSV